MLVSLPASDIAATDGLPAPPTERRVLAVVRWPVGGIRTHIAYTYPALAEAGYRFTFVLPEDGSRGAFEQSLTHLPGCEFVEAPRLGTAVRRLLRGRRFGLIHSHGVTAAVHATVGGMGFGVPHLTTVHDVFRADQFGGSAGWAKRQLLARVLRRVGAIASVTRDVQENLLEYLPAVGRRGGSRLFSIPNGIDTRHYRDATPPEGWLRERVGCGKGTAILGFLGRFVEQKGFTHLLQALEVLAREGGRPFHLVAVGSGDRRSRSEREIAERGLGRHVTLFDFMPDVLPVLRQLDLLVVPSLWEASSLLSMEAMSVGVPVLGSDCVGLREVLAGTPSRQFATGNVADLARALRLELDAPHRGEARAFASAARARFDVRQYALRFAEEFDRMFDPGVRRPAETRAAIPALGAGWGWRRIATTEGTR